MRSLRTFFALILGAISVSGCHSALADAMDSYTDARYPSAAAQFRALERASRQLDAQGFANYALYRGLTHLALGDARAAARWLGHAKQCADRDPAVFDDDERGALSAAWRSMGHMPGEPGFAAALGAAPAAPVRGARTAAAR
ncbi:MAG: hypothetical protein ABJB12_16410 [Pseudomonadota bacterium]